MLVTNNAALLAIVPLTMSLHVERQDWLVILEILAANAGSAYIFNSFETHPNYFFGTALR